GRTRNALPGDLVCAGQQVWMMTAQGMRCLSGIGANDVFEAANGWLFERSAEVHAEIEVLDLLRSRNRRNRHEQYRRRTERRRCGHVVGVIQILLPKEE